MMMMMMISHDEVISTKDLEFLSRTFEKSTACCTALTENGCRVDFTDLTVSSYFSSDWSVSAIIIQCLRQFIATVALHFLG